jgi:cytosine/adenosine deaminase-related metal-dependent hydrolase
MMEPTVFRNARYVLTMDKGRILENTDVRVKNGIIDSIGENISQRGGEIIDSSGSILMPGLVNSHTHAAMVMLRGLNDDAPLQEWLKSMWDLEAKITPEQEEIGAEMGFLEMVRTGTTACLDQYGADPAVKAAGRTGIRVGCGVPLITVWGGAEERLVKAKEFLVEYKGHDRIVPVVNLHSTYTNTEETVAKCGEMSMEENVPLHVHCSETRKEVFDNRRERGRLGVEELDHHGCIWEKSVLVHMGWASSWEFNIIRDKGASLVHCPASNQKLATGGFFPFKDLKEMGVRVGLGTDGAASNNSLDMFREMRQMALVQKGQYWNALAAGAHDVLESAITSGNGILGLNGGRISEGMNADLCLLKMGPGLGPVRKDNLLSLIVYSAVGNDVVTTMVGGDLVYNDGMMLNGTNLSERYLELAELVNSELY